MLAAAVVAACQLQTAKFSMSSARRRRGKKKGRQTGQWKRSRTSAIARIATDHPTPTHLPHLMIDLTAHPILLLEGSGKKRAAQRKKKAEKLKQEMEEGKRAQDELDQLKKVIEEEAEKKVQDATAGADSPATDGSAHSVAKGDASFTLAQIKELMRFAKERATPPRTPSNNSNHNTKPPRNVFANIIVTQKSTVVIEDLDEVQDTRREILSWLSSERTHLRRPRKFKV